ncbi:MAG: hypothetical protein WCJ99_10145 [Betaproteobacteria bacterium]
MIYITEMSFEDPARLTEWHKFYLENIANLQSCPGFIASQRFEAVVDTLAPYTAVHEIESPAVFETDIYRTRGGRQSNGDWQAQMKNWHRNLYSGIDTTPRVPFDAFLVYFDAPSDVAKQEFPLPLASPVHWLELAGLDRTIAHRGVAILAKADEQIEFARHDERIKVFKPITDRIANGRPLSEFTQT